jgi:hypothetical protein
VPGGATTPRIGLRYSCCSYLPHDQLPAPLRPVLAVRAGGRREATLAPRAAVPARPELAAAVAAFKPAGAFALPRPAGAG